MVPAIKIVFGERRSEERVFGHYEWGNEITLFTSPKKSKKNENAK